MLDKIWRRGSLYKVRFVKMKKGVLYKVNIVVLWKGICSGRGWGWGIEIVGGNRLRWWL